MKKLLFSLLATACLAFSLNAQKTNLPAVYQSKAEIVAAYGLDDEQIDRLDIIIATRDRNLSSIESLRANDEKTFWQKRRAIYLGQRASIERMLRTPEQKAVFAEQKKNDRIAESEIIKRLIAEGRNRADAKLLLLAERY